MVGAYISWIVMSQLGLSPVLAIILSIGGCAGLGVLIDKVAYQPLREAPRMSLLITAIGVSYFLENGAQLVFGADAKVVPDYFDLPSLSVGDVSLSANAIITIAVTAISTIVLTILVQKTKLGKAMRAVSEDMGAARLMGINVNNTISFTFAVGSALAGIGAVLYSMAYTQATPTMGIMLGTKAFVAAVLGGIGSIPGAVIGGLLVGFAEVFVSAIGLSVWQDAVVFLLLIIVLVVRPTGILGRPMTEKV
jgi:branched-chain amino acid transport system permease protein